MEDCRIPVGDVRVGTFIRLDLPWFKHPFLLSSFKVRNNGQIDVLKGLGLKTVIYIPEKSDPFPEGEVVTCLPSEENSSATGQSLQDELWTLKKERIERLKTQRKKFGQCEKQFEQALDRVRGIMRNLGTASQEIVEEADALVGGMVNSLLSDKETVVHLMSASSGNEDLFYHSLNTVVLGLLLGKECGLKAKELKHLGMGLIFHDIGKQRIPKGLLLKHVGLTPAEQKLIRLHPKYGEEMMVARVHDFPEVALEVIGKHHEALNGKGSPDGLAAEKIPPLARVAAIADSFDNHCNKHELKDCLTPHQALSHMFGKQKDEFDPQFMATFVRCLGVYPPGSIVLLSNGSVGMVVGINTKNTLRPSVLLYDKAIPKSEALVLDMDDEPGLNISKCIHPSQLPQQVYDYLSPRSRVSYFTEPAAASKN